MFQINAILIALSLIGHINAQITQQCLDCICEASSDCNLDLKCHNTGPNSYHCGPYGISWAYWSDAGKPGDTGQSQDFEFCLNDKECADQTVIGYMEKYGNDCNEDGVVDCSDYAAIHQTGPNNCHAEWLLNSDYWYKFQQTVCYTLSMSSGSSFGSNLGHSDRRRTPYGSHPNNVRGPNTPVTWTFVRHSNNTGPTRNTVRNGVSTSERGNSFINRPFRGTISSTNPRYPSISHVVNTVRRTHTSSVNRPLGVNSDNYKEDSDFTDSESSPFGSSSFGSSVSTVHRSNRPRTKPLVSHRPFGTGPRPRPEAEAGGGSRVSVRPNFTPVNGPVEQYCLDCLCYAASKCNLNQHCSGTVCGPFLISWAYWADGGKQGGDYVTCSRNKACSESTVQGYMNKWQQDCNGDGVIDCVDFAMIHQLGPYACTATAITSGTFWSELDLCLNPTLDSRRKPAFDLLSTVPNQPFSINSHGITEALTSELHNEHPSTSSAYFRSLDEVPNLNFRKRNRTQPRSGDSLNSVSLFLITPNSNSTNFPFKPFHPNLDFYQKNHFKSSFDIEKEFFESNLNLSLPYINPNNFFKILEQPTFKVFDYPTLRAANPSVVSSNNISNNFYKPIETTHFNSDIIKLVNDIPFISEIFHNSDEFNVLDHWSLPNREILVSNSSLPISNAYSRFNEITKPNTSNVDSNSRPIPRIITATRVYETPKPASRLVTSIYVFDDSSNLANSRSSEPSRNINSEAIVYPKEKILNSEINLNSTEFLKSKPELIPFREEIFNDHLSTRPVEQPRRRQIRPGTRSNSELRLPNLIVNPRTPVIPSSWTRGRSEEHSDNSQPLIRHQNQPSLDIIRYETPVLYPEPNVVPVIDFTSSPISNVNSRPRSRTRTRTNSSLSLDSSPNSSSNSRLNPSLNPNINFSPDPSSSPDFSPSPSSSPSFTPSPSFYPSSSSSPSLNPNLNSNLNPNLNPSLNPNLNSSSSSRPSSRPRARSRSRSRSRTRPNPLPNSTPAISREVNNEADIITTPASSHVSVSVPPVSNTVNTETFFNSSTRRPVLRENFSNDNNNRSTVAPVLNSTLPLPPSYQRSRYTFKQNEQAIEIPKNCLKCICEASTSCDKSLSCVTTPGFGKVCGAYQISLEYWNIAGKPGYRGSAGDFEKCAMNLECSEETVKRYMTRIAHDCNDDKSIDCIDYAAVHKIGSDSCQSQNFLESQYWYDFQECYGFERK